MKSKYAPELIQIMESYCVAILEILNRPNYTLTPLKIRRIKQMLNNALNAKKDYENRI